MEFALDQLWDRQEWRVAEDGTEAAWLTNAAYDGPDGMGGVVGALARHADGVYAALDDADRARVRRVLTDLTRVARLDEEGLDTRRTLSRSAFDAADWPIVGRLVDERLLVSGRDPCTGEETAEVAHEALVRHWPRLVGWLNADRAFLLWRDRTREGLKDWKEDPTAVLRGSRLAEADRWLAERCSSMREELVAFIEESRKAHEVEIQSHKDRQQERETQLKQFAEEQKKRADSEATAAKRLRRLALAAQILACIGIGAAMFARSQWQRAEQQAGLALEREMIAKEQEEHAKHQALQARVSSNWSRLEFNNQFSFQTFETDALYELVRAESVAKDAFIEQLARTPPRNQVRAPAGPDRPSTQPEPRPSGGGARRRAWPAAPR
jgi:hypothetical protein